MQNQAVILGGFEPVYMQKLALYLGSRLGRQVRVGIAQSASFEADEDTVWIGSEEFLRSIRSQAADAKCILLAEEPTDAAAVYRYQSCEKLYQQIILCYRQFFSAQAAAMQERPQHWVVLTTDGPAASLLAFSLTCAQILGQRGRTLYLNFTECCGMSELFLLEPGTDLSDLTAALRREEPGALESCVRQMEQIDYILPPANPMILHELRERDIDRLIEAVGEQGEYEYVVTALGNTCCGCDRFFRMAERLFHLAASDFPQGCSQKEWLDFIALCRGSQENPVERICLPQIEADGSGVHLLSLWQEGALGQLARIYLDGEARL